MYLVVILSVLAFAACGGGMEHSGVQAESLFVGINASAPIEIRCMRGEACEASALGQASATIEADVVVSLGVLSLPARLSVKTSAGVQSSEDGPDIGARISGCLESPILGPLCFESAR